MKEFSLNLYRFLDSHKNDKIDFVDKTLKIGKYNLLNEEEIGLLSISCINHKTIKKIKNLAESYSNYSMEELEQIEENKGLSDQEIYMLNFMENAPNAIKEPFIFTDNEGIFQCRCCQRIVKNPLVVARICHHGVNQTG